MLVELVMGFQTSVYVEVLEQHRTGSRVFCQYQFGIAQHLHGPYAHVIEVPDRSRYYVKSALPHQLSESLRRPAIISL